MNDENPLCNAVPYALHGWERTSGFELLRIIAMMLVLITHADFYSIGLPNHEDCVASPISSFMRLLTESLGLVCVNVYILVSGYFGITLRRRSIMRLLFLILFWRGLVVATFCIIGKFNFMSDLSYSLLLLVPGYRDWFVSCYLLLLMFAPALNSYISSVSDFRLMRYTIILLSIEVIIPMFSREIFTEYFDGYSALSFMILYLTGATIRRYQSLSNIHSGVWVFYYLGISWLAATVTFNFHLFSSSGSQWLNDEFLSYTGICVLPASICLFMAFASMRTFKSVWINKVAASVFAVYVFHMHPLVAPYFSKACRLLFNDYPTWTYLGLISLFLSGIFIFVVCVDRLRICVWNMIEKRIR